MSDELKQFMSRGGPVSLTMGKDGFWLEVANESRRISPDEAELVLAVLFSIAHSANK